jgi:hypothetical protein
MAAQKLGVLGLLHMRSDRSLINSELLYKQLIRTMTDCAVSSEGQLLAAMSGRSTSVANQVQVLAFRLTHLDTLVTCSNARIWPFFLSPAISEH